MYTIYMNTLFDLVKVIVVISVLYFVYTFMQSQLGGDFQLESDLGGGGQLDVTNDELWGNPSPWRGTVTIQNTSTPTATSTQDEYLSIKASLLNTSSIELTGWSLHSIVSNTRIYLPPATLLLKMTGDNDVQPVHLAPGEYAILHSGSSPVKDVATSFHTNSCIGYVSTLNEFTPPLQSDCNNPHTILPATPQNITTYGSECIEFLQEADSCKSYTTEMPAHLLPACRDLIARKLTYHSCLSDALANKGYEIFNNGGWYLYLNHEAEIWRNNYEAIQLLDQNGLVVDVLRY